MTKKQQIQQYLKNELEPVQNPYAKVRRWAKLLEEYKKDKEIEHGR